MPFFITSRYNDDKNWNVHRIQTSSPFQEKSKLFHISSRLNHTIFVLLNGKKYGAISKKEVLCSSWVRTCAHYQVSRVSFMFGLARRLTCTKLLIRLCNCRCNYHREKKYITGFPKEAAAQVFEFGRRCKK